MERKTNKILASASVVLAATASFAQSYVPGEVIVKLKANSWGSYDQGWKGGAIGVVTGRDLSTGLARVKTPIVLNVEAAVRRLRNDKNVEWAEPNYIFANDSYTEVQDPMVDRQWNVLQTGTNNAWKGYSPKADVVLAIVDTGVDLTHPDLTSMLYRRNGKVAGFNAINGTDNVADDNGHGTLCAGIADAQTANGVGIGGVAGKTGENNRGVKIMPIKALGSNGSGNSTDIYNGIMWAVDNGASVVSMSFGAAVPSSAIALAVNYARARGVVVVGSAGNDGKDRKNYPAASPGVIAVASTDPSDSLSSFSQFGSWVQVAAPGSNILTTARGSKYSSASGTSVAAPFVSGEFAMLLAQNPGLGSTQASTILLANTSKLKPLPGKSLGGGRVDVQRAFTAAAAVTAAGIQSATLSNDSLSAAQTATLNLTFSNAMPGTGGKINLSANTLGLELLKQVTAPGGSTSMTVQVKSSKKVTPGNYTLIAEYNGRRTIIPFSLK